MFPLSKDNSGNRLRNYYLTNIPRYGMESLDRRIQIVWLIQATITAVVLGGIASLFDVFWVESGFVLPIAVFAPALVLLGIHSILRYRVWGFEIRQDELYLQRGVITRVRTVVPYVRIQHVDSRRGPLERLIGLATTVVYTAGSRGADVVIPGLTPERSEQLQEELKQLAIESEGEDAV